MCCKCHSRSRSADKYTTKENMQSHIATAQVFDIEQIANTPPTWRVSIAQPAPMKAHCKHTTYLENTDGSSKVLNTRRN
jgi:3-mercaptopyruvate sulfurtransferase SseA